MDDDPWEGYSLPKGYSMPPPPGVPIFVNGDDKPTYETVRNEDGTIEIVAPQIQSLAEAKQEFLKNIRAQLGEGICGQQIGEHVCNRGKSECGLDDPHVVHHCYYGDCDWKSMEFVQVKLGQLSVADAVLAGHARNRLGNHDKTTEELVAWMEENGPDTCASIRENMRRLEAGP